MNHSKKHSSGPFQLASASLIDNGISVIPIFPGQKKPGSYRNGEWRDFVGWQKYCKSPAASFVVDTWESWPGGGIGCAMGEASGVVGLDEDFDRAIFAELGCLALHDQLKNALPGSPVKKKGAKGQTSFFKYNGESTVRFRVRGKVVLEILSNGTQTVLPPSRHPAGVDYHYLTPDTLEDYAPSGLPTLPSDFVEQIKAIIRPYQDESDADNERRYTPDEDGNDFRNINNHALANLDMWVPELLPDARKSGGNYRARADWRGVDNYNVSIHCKGIKDYGNDESMTPIDLVMKASGNNCMDSKNWLAEKINIRAEVLIFKDDRPPRVKEAEKLAQLKPDHVPENKAFFIDINDVELREPQWLIENYIEKNTLNCFFGEPGAGKSFLSIDIALSIANGTQWNGCNVTAGPVLVIAGEGHNGLKKRVCAWEKVREVKTQRGAIFFSQMPAQLSDTKAAEWVGLQIKAVAESVGIEPVMVLNDTLARNMGADENSSKDMNDFILNVDKYIRVPYQSAVLIVHHTGHADKTRARGSMALKGALDSEYRIEKSTEDVNKNAVIFTCTKMKDFEKPQPPP